MRISDWSSDVCSSDLQVVAVEVLQLHEVEARRRLADRVEVEPFDGLLGGDDLVVAMAPAEAQQIVAQRLRQVAQVAVGVDAEGAVALRQLGPVGPVDQRTVGEGRRFPVPRLVELVLAKGVGPVRSEGRRVGKACVRTCRYRMAPYH